MRLVLFLILPALFLASCASRNFAWQREPSTRGSISEVKNAARDSRRSNTWDVTKKPLDGRQWLAANREDRLRLELASENGIGEADARLLLESLVNQGSYNLRTAMMDDARWAEIDSALRQIGEAESEHLASLTSPEERQQWARTLRA